MGFLKFAILYKIITYGSACNYRPHESTVRRGQNWTACLRKTIDGVVSLAHNTVRSSRRRNITAASLSRLEDSQFGV